MATGKISERKPKLGNVVKHEYNLNTGYTRSAVDVAVPAAGLSIGAVLENTTNANVYNLVNLANVANASAVLIDPVVNDDTVKGATFELAVLDRGPNQIAGDALIFAADVTTSAQRQTAYDTLEALGFEVLKQV